MRAFGAANRHRLLEQYFTQNSASAVEPQFAWQHVYRLLLWIDQTTGLAHCYESDKSQPGRHWYARSLAFHDWVSSGLNVPAGELSSVIDWLFLFAAKDLAAEVQRRAKVVSSRAREQRRPYDGRGFPEPGEDPELVTIFREELGAYLESDPPDDIWIRLVQRVRQYLSLDNKRKNLVGEGFEDVLAQVISRTCPGDQVEVRTRCLLHELPGFNRVRDGDKPNKVDVAVLRPGMRTLVTAKWSVRADREKQFVTDFADYVVAESARQPFEYVFVTNEFDPARLVRACDQLATNALMFANVVHINTDGLRAAYGAPGVERSEAASMGRVLEHINSGRLISIEQWLRNLGAS